MNTLIYSVHQNQFLARLKTGLKCSICSWSLMLTSQSQEFKPKALSKEDLPPCITRTVRDT